VHNPQLPGYDIHPGPSKEDLHTGHNVDPVNNPLVLEKTKAEGIKEYEDRNGGWEEAMKGDKVGKETKQYRTKLDYKTLKEVGQNKLELQEEDVRQTKDGEIVIGTMADGTQVCIREFSSEGYPTAEFQSSIQGSKKKFRDKIRGIKKETMPKEDL
jgi:hypothetical protein